MKEKQDNKKRWLVAVLLFALIGVTGGWVAYSSGVLDGMHSPNHAAARHRPTVSQTHGMSAVLSQRLGLNTEQTTEVEKIGQEMQEKLLKLKTAGNLSPEQLKAEGQKVMDQGSAKLSAILNDEQQAKFSKMRMEMKEGHKM